MEVISNESQNKHLKRNDVFVETEMGFNRGEKDSSNNRKALLCPSLGLRAPVE